MQASFLWHRGGSGNHNKWTHISWSTITRTKTNGGLGVRDLSTQNTAPITHLVLRFLTNQNAWWVRLLQGKYLKSVRLKDNHMKKTDSKTWKAILKHWPHIFPNQRWVIGNGHHVIALNNYWVPGLGPLRNMLRKTTNPNDPLSVVWVKDPIDHDPFGVRWNLPLLRSLWEEHVVQAIVSLPLGGTDIRCWENELAGTCRFKTLYKHLLPRHICPSLP